MELYSETAQDEKGNIINGANVYVYVAATGVLATIYDKDGIAQDNDFLSGLNRSNGEIEFAAANGKYNIKVVNGSDTVWHYNQSLFDVNDASGDDIVVSSIALAAIAADLPGLGTAVYVGQPYYPYSDGLWPDMMEDKSYSIEVYNENDDLGVHAAAPGIADYANPDGLTYANSGDDKFYKYIVDYTLWGPEFTANGWQETFRGSKKKIPSAILPVAEAGKVILYDMTQGEPVMWMGANGGNYRPVYSSGTSSIEMRGGKIFIGNNATGQLGIIDLLNDKMQSIRSTAAGTINQVSRRNAALTAYDISDSTIIVNPDVNAITLTQLDNAPVDEYGVKADTSLAGTDGGGSFVKDDDTVVDVTSAAMISVDIQTSGRSAMASTSDVYIFNEVPNADTTTASADFTLNSSSTPAIDGTIETVEWSGDELIIGTSTGLFRLKYNQTTPAESIISKQTDEIPPIKQPLDIAGCWLADTDDTDVTGSELAPDLTGYADEAAAIADGWSLGTGWSFDATNDEFDCDGTQTATSNLAYPTTIADNDTIVIVYTVANYSAGTIRSNLTGVGGTYRSANGVYVETFKSIIDNPDLQLQADADFIGSVKAFAVRIANPDRSVNNLGAQQFGTDTRTALGTAGKSLVLHSGYSSSNFQEVPYTSLLDVGTGDCFAFGYVDVADLASQVILSKSPKTSIVSPYFEVQAHNVNGISWIGNAGTSKLTDLTDYSASEVVPVAFIRRDGIGYLYVNGDLKDSAANTDNYDHSNADTLRFGSRQDGYSAAFIAGLSAWHIGLGTLSTAQYKWILDKEKPLIQGRDCVLGGTDAAIDWMSMDSSGNLWVIAGGKLEKLSPSGAVLSSETTTATMVSALEDGRAAL